MNTVNLDYFCKDVCWLKCNDKIIGQRSYHKENHNMFVDKFLKGSVSGIPEKDLTLEVDENLYCYQDKLNKKSGKSFEFLFKFQLGGNYRLTKYVEQSDLHKISQLCYNINSFLYGLNMMKTLGIIGIKHMVYDFINYSVKIYAISFYDIPSFSCAIPFKVKDYINDIERCGNLTEFSISISYQNEFFVLNSKILDYLAINYNEKAFCKETENQFFSFPYLNKNNNLILLTKESVWDANKVEECKIFLHILYSLILENSALSLLTDENFDDYFLSLDISEKQLIFKYIPHIENDTSLSLKEISQAIYETLLSDEFRIISEVQFEDYEHMIPQPILDVRINEDCDLEFIFKFNFNYYMYEIVEFNLYKK